MDRSEWTDGWMDGPIDQWTDGRENVYKDRRRARQRDSFTLIGVVESGGVDGADTGGLGLATLVSNGLRVAALILAVVKILR